uniref:Uncharacterized protein n=1 Tax=Aegilops tauschii subsp. strangulata TaxID=200361 RepID=A0A453IR52_AEGTS
MEVDTSSATAKSGGAQPHTLLPPPGPPAKKKRALPGMPDPDAEVIALSPKTLMATNRFVCARSATRGSSGTRTCSCTGGATTCRGSSGSGAARRCASGCTCARSRAACTTTPPAPSATSPASRSTSAASTARRSGSAISAPRSTPCSPTGRRTPRPAAPASTAATAAPSSPGGTASSPTAPSATRWQRRAPRRAPRRRRTGAPARLPRRRHHQPLRCHCNSCRQQREIGAAPEPVVQYTPPAPLMPSPPSVNGANVSASTSSVAATSQSLLGSMFAPSSVAQTAQYPERALAAKPPSLCLATDAASAQFSAPTADRQQQLVQPPPSPSPSAHMSATALLQKAAQMGATSSSSSFLRGLGLDISSSSPASTSSGQHQQQHHHHQQHHQEPMQMQFPEGSLQQWPPRLEPEPAPMMSAGLGLGLPYDSTGGPMGLPELMMGQSSLFSAKPATLDF